MNMQNTKELPSLTFYLRSIVWYIKTVPSRPKPAGMYQAASLLPEGFRGNICCSPAKPLPEGLRGLASDVHSVGTEDFLAGGISH